MWTRGLGQRGARTPAVRMLFVGFFVSTALAAAAFATPILHAIAPISQDFLADKTIPLGSIVSLQKDSSDHVSAATPDTTNYVIGVVIDGDNAPISLSNDQANHVEVATSGVVPVLVSDINGDVTVGDQITASPIGGVGMKATANAKVVGIAQADLASTSNTQQQSYTDKQGQKHTVLLGEVPVLVNVAYYYKQPDKTIIPSAVQNLANALAGKTVSALPILISAGIFIVTLVVVVTLIYTMIRSSIISVGRNPMAQSAVYRNLIQLSVLVVIILGVAVASMYLVLTRL